MKDQNLSFFFLFINNEGSESDDAKIPNSPERGNKKKLPARCHSAAWFRSCCGGGGHCKATTVKVCSRQSARGTVRRFVWLIGGKPS